MQIFDKKGMNPKNTKDSVSTLIVLIIATLAACIVRFSASYAEIDDDIHSKIWLGVSFLAGITGGIICRKNFLYSGLIATTGFIIAIVLRIVYDLIFVDPTSHNLFPIELVMWSIMALIPALAGAFLSSMILRIINKV
jgi:hypothetical protein